MGTKPKKRKGKIRVRTGAKVVKKDSVRNDTLPQMPIKKIVPDNGATFKIKLRRKQ
jgi:hypothetical protein